MGIIIALRSNAYKKLGFGTEYRSVLSFAVDLFCCRAQELGLSTINVDKHACVQFPSRVSVSDVLLVVSGTLQSACVF